MSMLLPPIVTLEGSGYITGLDANDVDYGKIWMDNCKDSTVVFGNTGTAPITVTALAIQGLDSNDFTSRRHAAVYDPPGGTHAVVVRFCPSTFNTEEFVTMLVTTDASTPPVVTLQGMGIIGGLAANNIDYGKRWLDSCAPIRRSCSAIPETNQLSLPACN